MPDSKSVLASDYFKKNRIDPCASFGLGDSFQDVGIMENVGYPAFRKPDDEARTYAEKHGFLICNDDHVLVTEVRAYLSGKPPNTVPSQI